MLLLALAWTTWHFHGLIAQRFPTFLQEFADSLSWEDLLRMVRPEGVEGRKYSMLHQRTP
jgi:hypothetical protein